VSLRARQLCCRRGDSFALHIDNWEAHPGELQAVLGTNGAGKSSFFAALSGGLPVSGELGLHGRPLSDWPARERARHLGVLTQHSQMDFAFRVEEVVALGLTPLSLGWRAAQHEIRAVMRRCDCAHLAGRAYPDLSGGERQRVQLARVLLQLSQARQPPLLLLDEPTSAQDLGHQHHLLTLARSLAHEQGHAVVVILHDLNHALRYADRCSLLAGGRLIGQGAPAQVLTPQRVAEVWGYPVRPLRAADGMLALL
jgi:iron complex transport system ATP-binding protein